MLFLIVFPTTRIFNYFHHIISSVTYPADREMLDMQREMTGYGDTGYGAFPAGYAASPQGDGAYSGPIPG